MVNCTFAIAKLRGTSQTLYKSFERAKVMLLSIQNTVSLGRPLVPWSIVKVNEEDYSFQNLFEKVPAGCFKEVQISTDLKNALLLRSFVGAKTRYPHCDQQQSICC